MKKKENILFADSGKSLKTPYGYFDVVTLGEKTVIKDGEMTTEYYDKKNIKEVTKIQVGDTFYYIEDVTDYGTLVTELIRQKYSLDDELALMANSRLGINKDQEEEFQAWRVKCKEAAKKIFQ